jgi:adenylate kinase
MIAKTKMVLLGPPGAGKGTASELLLKDVQLAHVSTGDIFRANIKNETELGMKAKAYMDKGLLVPDELVVDLLVDRIKQADCVKGYLLDGFPRTIPQAEALDRALNNRGDKVEYAINIDVPDEFIVTRMGGRRACVACGATYHVEFSPTKVEGICDKCQGGLIVRDDDKPETVKRRLEIYHEQTQPLIDYYAAQGALYTVDGTKDIAEVTAQIEAVLSK